VRDSDPVKSQINVSLYWNPIISNVDKNFPSLTFSIVFHLQMDPDLNYWIHRVKYDGFESLNGVSLCQYKDQISHYLIKWKEPFMVISYNCFISEYLVCFRIYRNYSVFCTLEIRILRDNFR
jgi:hypothetical protein